MGRAKKGVRAQSEEARSSVGYLVADRRRGSWQYEAYGFRAASGREVTVLEGWENAMRVGDLERNTSYR
jgi:hypothetical protein